MTIVVGDTGERVREDRKPLRRTRTNWMFSSFVQEVGEC